MSLRKPAVILACAAIAIVLLVSMGSLGPEPIESQSSFAQPETFTIKPVVTKFTEVSAVLEPSSTQLEPTASVMDVGLDKLSLFLNPAFAISSTQTDLSYTIYPNGGNYANGNMYDICGTDMYMGSGHSNKKIIHVDTITHVLTSWDITDIGTPHKVVCDNSGNVYFGTSGARVAKLDTQTNTVEWYSLQENGGGWCAGNDNVMGPNNEVYFHGCDGLIKFNFNTDTFTQYSNPGCLLPRVFDSAGILYATGSSGPNLCKIDFSSNTSTVWDLQPLESTSLHVRTVTVDQNDNLFAAISSHGKIARVDQSSNLVTSWQIPDQNSGPNDIEADSSGNVFFTVNGLWRLVPATDTFTKWGGFSAGYNTIIGNIIWSCNSAECWKLT